MKQHFGSASAVLAVAAFFLVRVIEKSGPIRGDLLLLTISIALLAIVLGALGVRKRSDADGYLISRKTAAVGLAGGVVAAGFCCTFWFSESADQASDSSS